MRQKVEQSKENIHELILFYSKGEGKYVFKTAILNNVAELMTNTAKKIL